MAKRGAEEAGGLKLRRPVPSYSRHVRRTMAHDRFHRRIAVGMIRGPI